VNDQPAQPSFRSDLLRLLVPLAALAAMVSYAAREGGSGGAESTYLAVLAAAVLLPAGFLAPWPAFELGLGAVLATAAVWVLSPGPGRGAAMVLVLAAVLAVAAGRRIASAATSPQGPAFFIPLALALQILLRGELLFAPALAARTAVALVALPVAGGLAVSLLARRHGTALALLAGGTALALAPGSNVACTLALLALAAGDVLARESAGRAAKVAAGMVLLAAVAWDPGPGTVAAVCGLALWRPRIALGLALATAAGLALFFHETWSGVGLQVLLLPLLVPAALLPGKGRIAAVGVAALMTATVPLTPGAAALAAPLALAVLAIRRDAAFVVPQGVWTGAALGGTALLASYPWLRAEPLATALSLLGRPLGPGLTAMVAGGFLVLAGVGTALRRRGEEPLRSVRLAGLAAAFLALALLAALPGTGTGIVAPESPVVLDAGHPVWEARLAGPAGNVAAVAAVVVDSTLSNSAGLAAGTPVAVVRFRDRGGRSAEWTLRAGEETGEWALRRPDVARTGASAPPPWVSWVAGDFLAQRYRARWTLPGREHPVLLRIERAAGVPPELAVALYGVEVRR
jgi:hypothetical protein